MRRLAGLSLALLLISAGCGGKEQPPSPPAGPSPAAEALAPPSADEASSVSAASEESEAAPPRLLPREEFEAGWISLFDGETLFGWRPNNDPEDGGVNWSVVDGAIVADSGEPGLLVTTVPFADYELRCDYRLELGGNSGLFLRTAFDPTDPAVDCYELNMADSHPAYPTGSLVGRHRVDLDVEGEGDWKTFHVRLQGPRIEAWLNGAPVLDFVDRSGPLLLNGYIGLQMNTGKIEFRNISLRPLGMRPIFNGEDLTGWREVPGSKSRFEVVDGAIRATDGPGFLETEERFDDFVFQGDAKTNGRHLNSGVFFRAMAGTEEAPSHGYEYQIHNGFHDGDRTRPIDAGTGAIFRRADARYVVADDEEWFTMTLVAYGPRFATWVNGYQVVDWEDAREPDENPRRGRRLEAGHISLQGHDPTTDLEFRELRIVDYPASAVD